MLSDYPAGTLERVQRVQVEILEIIAEICDEFDLTWFADSGTCLGAVRHGGFIPWDDDIDIAMPIGDYRTFCRVAPEVLEGSGYGVYLPSRTENYPPLFAKVYKAGTRFIGEQMAEAGFDEAIFVDVFAYARLDSKPSRAKRQASRLAFWQRMSYLRHIAHPVLPSGAPFKGALRKATGFAHAVVRGAVAPSTIESRFFAAVDDGDGMGNWTNVFYADYGTFPTSVLFPVGKLQFGDMIVPVPNDVDAYLTTLYGDYLVEPPDVEKCSKPPVILDFGDGVNVIDKRDA